MNHVSADLQIPNLTTGPRVREKYNFADALQAAGDGPQAERVRKEALDLHNSEVQKAVQELVTCAKGGQAIVDALSSDGL